MSGIKILIVGLKETKWDSVQMVGLTCFNV